MHTQLRQVRHHHIHVCHACHGENTLLKRVASICRCHSGQESITSGDIIYGRDGQFEVCNQIEPCRGVKQSGEGA